MSRVKINHSIVSGYVAKDAYVNEQRNFLSFNIGIDKSYKDNKGQWINQTAWIPVKLWGNADRINALATKIVKGSNVIVTGSVDQNSYKDRNGNDVYEVFLRALSIQKYDETSQRVNNNANNTTIVESAPAYTGGSAANAQTEDFSNMDFSFLENPEEIY